MNINLGQQIGIYRLDALLGEGGMGAVYQAFDLNLQRKVALKVMQPRLASNETFRARFLQEARAAAQLDHPSIIRILHFESLPELLYLVMAYVGGPNLRKYVSHRVAGGQPLPLAEILELVAQVAEALGYAHQRGIVHRDIKPDNLLLQPFSTTAEGEVPDLRVVVTDFGLAKLQYGGIQTQTGTFMGTLPYMSPEQCKGSELDGRSDLYSVGVVLYQLVTGQLPFAVNSPTEALHHHVNVAPPIPQMVRPGLPTNINEILLQSLAKEPENRFGSGEEMAHTLRKAAHNLSDGDEATMSPLPQAVTPVPKSGATRTGAGIPGQSIQSVRSDVIADPNRSDHLLLAEPGAPTRAVPLFNDTVLIGRGENCDVRPDDDLLSLEHIRLQRKGDGWQVIDLNSKNGTFLHGNRLLAGVPERWEVGQTLRLGRFSMQWRPAKQRSSAAVMSQVAENSGTLLRTNIADIGLRVEPAQIMMARGESVSLQVGVHNLGQRVTHFQVRQSGLPPGWVTLSEETLALMPGAEAHVAVAIAIPATESDIGGHIPFEIEARASGSSEVAAVIDCQLQIQAEHGLHIDMQPTQLAVGQTGRIALQNSGNVATTYKISGRDAADALTFNLSHNELTLEPGQKEIVSVAAAIKRRPFIGASRLVPFNIQVFAADAPDQVRKLNGMTTIKPLIPGWLVPLVGLAALLFCGLLGGGAYAIFGRPEATATSAAIVEVTEEGRIEATAIDNNLPTDEPTTPQPTATPTMAVTNTPRPTATLNPTNTPQPTATRPPAGAAGLGSGLGERVRAITSEDEFVYVGGDFAGGIRRWNQQTLQWSELGGGVDGSVYDIALYKGEVYVTGDFFTAINGNGSEVRVNNVAVWNGAEWRTLGSGVSANPWGLAIAVDDEGTVYVGGAFNSPFRNIARWTTADEQWHGLGYDDELDAGVRNNGNDITGDFVNDIVIDGDSVYVTGQFHVASEDLNNINVPNTTNLARWDRQSQRWSAVGGGPIRNIKTTVYTLAFFDGVLYVGGQFDDIYIDDEQVETGYLAAWDGERWQTYLSAGIFAEVIFVDESGLYIAGFSRDIAGYAAYWDGTTWQGIATGEDFGALHRNGAYLYLGGGVLDIDGQTYANIASWVGPE